jgi:hypothetical protein
MDQRALYRAVRAARALGRELDRLDDQARDGFEFEVDQLIEALAALGERLNELVPAGEEE